MFKRIEIWVLYLFVLVSVIFTISFGVLVRQELVGTTKAGKISKAALFLSSLPAQIKSSMSTLQEPDRFINLDGFSGEPNTQEIYLLLSRYNGDLKEGIVELIDLRNFNVLHTWNPDIDSFNDLISKEEEFKHLSRDRTNRRTILRHPLLTKDGGLIFKHNSPLRKIDSCSNLLFQNSRDIFHHSIESDSDGNIWVPTHIYPQTLPVEMVGRDIVTEGGFYDDGIAKLSPTGDILFEKSISQILIENDLEYLLFSLNNMFFVNDPIHVNDIQPVNEETKFWKKNDLFLSLRQQSMVLLYRPSTNRIIWKGTGKFFFQHDVNILDDSRISVFNNNKIYKEGDMVDGNNQVIIYDFATDKYSLYLDNALIQNEIRTPYQGRSTILPNGDLFIEESDYARTMYFNSDGSLRWTHVNRANNGNVYMLGWSRVLYNKEDINNVNNFLNTKIKCNE